MTNWSIIVDKEGERAKSKIEEIKVIAARSDNSTNLLSTLYRDVEREARRFEALIEEIYSDLDIDDPLIDAVDAIDDMWSAMVGVSANLLRQSQGLPLIDFPDDE